jgi:hypothetical protein
MAQGSSNKTADLLKSSVAVGTLLGWLRLARFAWSGVHHRIKAGFRSDALALDNAGIDALDIIAARQTLDGIIFTGIRRKTKFNQHCSVDT